MKRFSALALGLVLLGAGCAPAAAPTSQPVTNEPANNANEPEIVVEEISSLNNGLFQLDVPSSTIRWQASKVKFGHNGTIAPREGYVRIDAGTTTEGSVLVDMNTIKNLDQEGTMLQRLETHLRSADFFDVAQFPTSSFVIEKIEPVSGLDSVNYRVDGKMTIKNITKDFSFAAEVKQFDGGLRLTGRVTIDRTEYDIKYGSGKFFQNLGDALIDDNFHLDLDLTFLLQSEEGEAIDDSSGDIQGS